MTELNSVDCLGAAGTLAASIKDFAVREGQQDMALAIEQALESGTSLVCEAGTGTGKTFAYLVPALLSGIQTIVSTGTKTLQDQLFQKDLPLVQRAIGSGAHIALLKGRANYLCPYRFELFRRSGEASSPHQQQRLQQIEEWRAHTQGGDLSEILQQNESTPLWAAITSTNENCLGQDCPDYARCYVAKARRNAQEADLTVINHHLFFSDAVIRNEGFGELLPDAGLHIFDEAHQLPQLATQFFSQSVGHSQFLDFARDCRTLAVTEAKVLPDLQPLSEQLMTHSTDLLFAFGDEQRRPWPQLQQQSSVMHALVRLQETVQLLKEQLHEGSKTHTALMQCHQRAVTLANRLQLTTAEAQEQQVQWVEVRRRSYTLNATPLSVRKAFSDLLCKRGGSWVFTSATLSVNGSFDHFTHALALDDCHCESWPSPFDYSTQALLYLPKQLPAPGSAGYTQASMHHILPILEASQGRAFLLFTSFKALGEAAQWLRAEVSYPLFVQGELPKSQILEAFRHSEQGVLLGTSSFWEGVDVKGEALSCVIIDKLPFASPGDPVLQARIEAAEKNGQNGFVHIQLPHAVIMLKQGVGRLIRDAQDQGVMVICDPRLTQKGYGKTFLRSLPPMPVSHQLEDVIQFFCGSQQ